MGLSIQKRSAICSIVPDSRTRTCLYLTVVAYGLLPVDRSDFSLNLNLDLSLERLVRVHGALASCQANARTYRATDFTIFGSIVSAVSVGW